MQIRLTPKVERLIVAVAKAEVRSPTQIANRELERVLEALLAKQPAKK